MNKDSITSESVRFLLDLTEPVLVHWLRNALAGKPAPLAAFFPGDPPAAKLAEIPRFLPVDGITHFRRALALLVKSFADRPAAWPGDEAGELIGLAELLGTRALPGHEPWELGLELSLKPLVEGRPTVFDALPLRLRLNVLALLGANPCPLPGVFWEKVYNRRPEYCPPAWRGMLRTDWPLACKHLMDFPHDPSSLAALRHHARYAALRIEKDDTGRLRGDFVDALKRSDPRVRDTIEKEAGKLGVSLSPALLGAHLSATEWVYHWLDISPGPDGPPMRDAKGEPVSDECMANLIRIMEDVFTSRASRELQFNIDEYFCAADTHLRSRFPEGSRELQLLDLKSEEEHSLSAIFTESST